MFLGALGTIVNRDHWALTGSAGSSTARGAVQGKVVCFFPHILIMGFLLLDQRRRLLPHTSLSLPPPHAQDISHTRYLTQDISHNRSLAQWISHTIYISHNRYLTHKISHTLDISHNRYIMYTLDISHIRYLTH